MRLDVVILLTRWDMERITQALLFVEEHYRESISADQLSLEVNLCKEKLQAGIYRQTGLTLHLHLLKLRTEKAKELLLDTEHPVKYIAFITGFKTSSHFIEIFKRFQYETPNQHRTRQAAPILFKRAGRSDTNLRALGR